MEEVVEDHEGEKADAKTHTITLNKLYRGMTKIKSHDLSDDGFYGGLFFGDSTSKLVLEPFLFEVLSDDDEDALSLFVWAPLLQRRTVEKHSYAVENIFHWRTLNGEESFHPVNVGAFFHEDLAEELVCSRDGEFGVHLIGEGSDS